MTLPLTMRHWIRRLTGSPEYDRLVMFINDAWSDYDREVHASGPMTTTEPWARSAYMLLLRAESQLANMQIEEGWTAALAAQRAVLSNPHNPDRIKRTAIALRREADKLTGWRAKAIQDLICTPDRDLIPIGPDQLMQVVDAVALRDDFSQNTWFKIVLRRRHLLNVFLILWLAILACWILSGVGILPKFLGFGDVSLVILFGVLGAAVSVAQSLIYQDVSERIPTQQLGALVIWMRPGIGAAASLIVFALLNANEQFKLLGTYTREPAVVTVFSFVAGYSERFIVGALERFSPLDPNRK